MNTLSKQDIFERSAACLSHNVDFITLQPFKEDMTTHAYSLEDTVVFTQFVPINPNAHKA
jgi:hypothetical protein